MNKPNQHSRIQIGVVGAGYWGPNIIRNLNQIQAVDLKTVCDLDASKLQHLQQQQPQLTCQYTLHIDDLLNDKELDSIAIVTDIDSHYTLAKKCLEAGKHVFVEKPLALSSNECMQLGKIAETQGKHLMVGHTFIYNPAVEQLQHIIRDEELGNIYYLQSQRVNLGRAQTKTNALWSLAVHDVAITLHLFQEFPNEVRCWGHSYITPGIEDVVFVNLTFPSGRTAHLHASWLSPEKQRRITIVGDRKMIVYDDVSLDQKIAIYDKGIQKAPLLNIQYPEYNDFSSFQLLTRVGDVNIPNFRFEEPLKIEMQHFIDCILGKVSEPLSGWKAGYDVVRVLEMAQQSLRQQGQVIGLHSHLSL